MKLFETRKFDHADENRFDLVHQTQAEAEAEVLQEVLQEVQKEISMSHASRGASRFASPDISQIKDDAYKEALDKNPYEDLQ